MGLCCSITAIRSYNAWKMRNNPYNVLSRPIHLKKAGISSTGNTELFNALADIVDTPKDSHHRHTANGLWPQEGDEFWLRRSATTVNYLEGVYECSSWGIRQGGHHGHDRVVVPVVVGIPVRS